MAEISVTPVVSGHIAISRFASVAFAGVVHQARAWSDGRKHGTLSISGSVYIDGTPDTPVSRKVRVFELASGRLMGEQWSDSSTGAYLFNDLAAGVEYTVLAHDHTAQFNAVVKDRVLAV